MSINADKTHLWKADVALSIDFYNDWFLRFDPGTYRKQRIVRTKEVLAAFEETENLETQQYAMLKRWLLRRGYKQIASDECSSLDTMLAGTFTFWRTLSPGKKKTSVNISIDCVVKPFEANKANLPIIIKAKSSGNATSIIRRAKKDAQKFAELKERYRENAKFILLLCGYFDGYYLRPEAAEGIDWVWQHRLDDMRFFLDVGRNKRKQPSRSIRDANPLGRCCQSVCG
jgi:hypothetical protein